jgi:hypothetical protein
MERAAGELTGLGAHEGRGEAREAPARDAHIGGRVLRQCRPRLADLFLAPHVARRPKHGRVGGCGGRGFRGGAGRLWRARAAPRRAAPRRARPPTEAALAGGAAGAGELPPTAEASPGRDRVVSPAGAGAAADAIVRRVDGDRPKGRRAAGSLERCMRWIWLDIFCDRFTPRKMAWSARSPAAADDAALHAASGPLTRVCARARTPAIAYMLAEARSRRRLYRRGERRLRRVSRRAGGGRWRRSNARSAAAGQPCQPFIIVPLGLIVHTLYILVCNPVILHRFNDSSRSALVKHVQSPDCRALAECAHPCACAPLLRAPWWRHAAAGAVGFRTAATSPALQSLAP